MIMQVILWVFVMFLTPSTKSHRNEDVINTNIEENSRDANIQPPREKKQLHDLNLYNNNGDNEGIIKVTGVPIQVKRISKNEDNHPEQQPYGENVDKKDTNEKDNIESNSLFYEKYYNKMLHHTILYKNASTIWKNSFIMNPTTICSRHNDLDLLAIVHTAPYNFKRRKMIREQISDKRINNPFTVQPVFMIGSVSSEKRDVSKDTEIVTEFNKYGDLVKMDFVEDFRNLSLKAIMWLRWSNEFCKNANMILKIDDDVVIDIQKILPLSRGLFSKYKRSIFCHLNKIGSQPIPRIGRTAVDPREFMRMWFYPYNYCSGFIVFLTPDLIPELEKSAQRIPFYNVDDVFMFGMVPQFAGHVTYHNIGYNVSVWNEKVLKCVRMRGSACSYFGTMAEEDVERLTIWNVMKENHIRDFHYPKLLIGPP